ncbi:hypothetical protein M9H77_05150 [Catharanthus roseus]|uniref:Uncharacterized protein n=1 Tax=Catharanthus roseus TaxID=4058 RepID=A0ACC0CGF6_CATRO|nr:hypothetical protein M9H77_05150 [Catharanthus roseus]
MCKNGVSLTTAEVETDSKNQTKEMTEAEQMNGHRADKRSPSSSNAASRRRENSLSRDKSHRQTSFSISLSFLSAHSLSKHTKGHAKVKRRPTRDRNTEKANTEKSSNNATREKAEEPERVQVELKETERSK